MEGSRSERRRDREACCEGRRSTGLQPLVRHAIGGRVLCLPTVPRHHVKWKSLRAMMPRTRPVGIWGKRKCVTEGCRQSADDESRRRGQLQTPRPSPKQQGESLNDSLRLLSGYFPMRPMRDRAMSRPAKMPVNSPGCSSGTAATTPAHTAPRCKTLPAPSGPA